MNQLPTAATPVALDMPSILELDRQHRNAHAAERPDELELYRNAARLELGASEISKMRLETSQ